METQKTIAEWGDATFGPVPSPLSSLIRASKEMSELLRAAETFDFEKLKHELPDVPIVLCRKAPAAPDQGDLVTFCRRAIQGPQVWINHAQASEAEAFMVVVADASAHLHKAITECAYRNPQSAAYYTFLTIDALHGAAGILRLNLGTLIDDKMVINRARRWRLIGDGHGQHVE